MVDFDDTDSYTFTLNVLELRSAILPPSRTWHIVWLVCVHRFFLSLGQKAAKRCAKSYVCVHRFFLSLGQNAAKRCAKSYVQKRKISPKRKSSAGRPCRHPATKTSVRPSKSWKTWSRRHAERIWGFPPSSLRGFLKFGDRAMPPMRLSLQSRQKRCHSTKHLLWN